MGDTGFSKKRGATSSKVRSLIHRPLLKERPTCFATTGTPGSGCSSPPSRMANWTTGRSCRMGPVKLEGITPSATDGLTSVSGRFVDPIVPNKIQLLFYDSASGVGEFYSTDGRGGLTLVRRHTGWPTSWTQIVTGRFGSVAGLLFYDASHGTGEFDVVSAQGFINPVKSFTNFRTSWHSIITGNFSSSQFDDLLFYDKGAGVGEFYKLDSNAGMTRLTTHTNWRRTWQHVVSGQFLQNAAFDGLLFYEEGSGYTEFYSTNGQGQISQIDITLGNQWSLPWQVILAGEFTPNIGLIGTSRLCSYDSRDGTHPQYVHRSRANQYRAGSEWQMDGWERPERRRVRGLHISHG